MFVLMVTQDSKKDAWKKKKKQKNPKTGSKKPRVQKGAEALLSHVAKLPKPCLFELVPLMWIWFPVGLVMHVL